MWVSEDFGETWKEAEGWTEVGAAWHDSGMPPNRADAIQSVQWSEDGMHLVMQTRHADGTILTWTRWFL
jgi:hypothetical protein